MGIIILIIVLIVIINNAADSSIISNKRRSSARQMKQSTYIDSSGIRRLTENGNRATILDDHNNKTQTVYDLKTHQSFHEDTLTYKQWKNAQANLDVQNKKAKLLAEKKGYYSYDVYYYITPNRLVNLQARTTDGLFLGSNGLDYYDNNFGFILKSYNDDDHVRFINTLTFKMLIDAGIYYQEIPLTENNGFPVVKQELIDFCKKENVIIDEEVFDYE